MKTIGTSIILAASLLFAVVGNAQFVRGSGIKAGIVAANQDWDYEREPLLTTDTRWGATAMAFLELLDAPFLSMAAEVQYTQKGFATTMSVTTPYNPEGYLTTLRPRIDYLSLPILLKIRIPVQPVCPYVVAGPRMDVLIARSGDYAEEFFRGFRTTEFGATVGVGVEVSSLLPAALLAECRYNAALQHSYTARHLTVDNRTFDLLIGVRL
jgi:hypothetical protein